jgi:hypothetical protein
MSKHETVYQHLASLTPVHVTIPTIEQVREIITSIKHGLSLDLIPKQQKSSGLSEDDVVHIVENLGRFISQSSKKTLDAQVIDWPESGTMFFSPTMEEIAKEIAAKRKDANAGIKGKATDFIPRDTNLDQPIVFLPQGWTRKETQKNLSKSFAAVCFNPVDDSLISRFIARNYRTREIDVTAEHVLLLLWLTENQMLERLKELGPKEHALARVLVKTWDLLHVTSVDAQRSLATLLKSTSSPQWDMEELMDACDRCEWLWPTEIGRLRSSFAAVVKDPSNESLKRIMVKRYVSFRYLSDSPSLKPVVIPEGLTAAHAHAICALTGLSGHESEERAVRTALREWLVEHGLGKDVDTEVAEGISAWKGGLLEEFYLNRALRAQGNPEWAAKWELTLTEAVQNV